MSNSPQFITFFKTNDIDDRGRDVSLSDVVRQFWASDDAKEWVALVEANKSVIPLERLALTWVADNIGSWGDDRSIWPHISDAIFDARPWKDAS